MKTTKTLKASSFKITLGNDNGNSENIVWHTFEGGEIMTTEGGHVYVIGTLTSLTSNDRWNSNSEVKNFTEEEKEKYNLQVESTYFDYEVGKDLGNEIKKYYKQKIKVSQILNKDSENSLTDIEKIMKEHFEYYKTFEK